MKIKRIPEGTGRVALDTLYPGDVFERVSVSQTAGLFMVTDGEQRCSSPSIRPKYVVCVSLSSGCMYSFKSIMLVKPVKGHFQEEK